MNNVLFDKPISDNHPIRAEVRRLRMVQVGPTEFEATRFNTMRTAEGLKEYAGEPSGIIFDAANGVYRWKSNNQVPPDDAELVYGISELPNYDAAKQTAVRKKETTAFLNEYRRLNRNRKPTGEELFEMRAAFGRGVTVVDVITGRRTRL